MQQDDFSGKWPAMKENIKKEYPHLTEEELRYEIGKEGELLERLQAKLGKNKSEIDKFLSIMG